MIWQSLERIVHLLWQLFLAQHTSSNKQKASGFLEYNAPPSGSPLELHLSNHFTSHLPQKLLMTSNFSLFHTSFVKLWEQWELFMKNWENCWFYTYSPIKTIWGADNKWHGDGINRCRCFTSYFEPTTVYCAFVTLFKKSQKLSRSTITIKKGREVYFGLLRLFMVHSWAILFSPLWFASPLNK